MKIKMKCNYCGKHFVIYRSNRKDINYCGRVCLGLSLRKHKSQNQGRRSPEDLNFKKQIAMFKEKVAKGHKIKIVRPEGLPT